MIRRNKRKGRLESLMEMNCSRSNNAFSLIELMIVIAIIGILVAILLPQLTGMSQDAQVSQTMQSLITMRDAVIRYNNENPNRPLENIDWLVPKYMQEISLDPWLSEFTIRPASGVLFSPGPDRDFDTAYDNIEEWYLPKLMIESAVFTDLDNDNIMNVPDTIRIRFTKPAADVNGGAVQALENYTSYLWFADDVNGMATAAMTTPPDGTWAKGGEVPAVVVKAGLEATYDVATVLTLNNIPSTGSTNDTATVYVNTHLDQVLQTIDGFLSVQNINPIVVKNTSYISARVNID